MAAPDASERVLLVVAQIPPGRVASYGDVGAVAGVGPRQVGLVLHRHGGDVPWWRVTMRDGSLAPGLLAEARTRWAQEGVGVSADGRRALMTQHRADPHQLAADYEAALAASASDQTGA